MYPVGFLFGLGFDTATEVAVLGLAATEAAKGLDAGLILLFPALFAAGMALIDTLDSTLMVGAYGWAFVRPAAKLHYNMTMTGISILIAVAVGAVEAVGLLAERLRLVGWPWDWVTVLNGNFALLGYLIVGIFAVSWLVSVFVYRLRRCDEIGADADSGRSCRFGWAASRMRVRSQARLEGASGEMRRLPAARVQNLL